MREIESQDILSMNPEFDSVDELVNFIIANQDVEPNWDYELNCDGYYDIWCDINDRGLQFEIWSDDIASDLDEKFDGVYDAGDYSWDREFMKRIRLMLKKM